MFSTLGHPFIRIFGKSPLQGAQTSLYCALEDFDKLVDGAYYADCKVTKVNPESLKEENGRKLWEVSDIKKSAIKDIWGEDAKIYL